MATLIGDALANALERQRADVRLARVVQFIVHLLVQDVVLTVAHVKAVQDVQLIVQSGRGRAARADKDGMMQALVPCVAGRQRIVEPHAPGSGREPQRDRHRQLEASHDKAPTSDEPPLDSGHKKSVYSPLKEKGGQSAYIY